MLTESVFHFSLGCREGPVPKMCTLGARQCKNVPIPGLRILVHSNQTMTFPVNEITIKVPKCTKYRIKTWDIFSFLVSV